MKQNSRTFIWHNGDCPLNIPPLQPPFPSLLLSVSMSFMEINPEYSLEGLMLKLQYFGYLMRRADSSDKTDAGKDWRQEKGTMEDEMAGWHHRLNGCEFEQAPGVGHGQGSLACCSPRGRKESDMTEQLIWSDLIPWWLSGKEPLVMQETQVWSSGWEDSLVKILHPNLISEWLWDTQIVTMNSIECIIP